ncbi:retrovirus-related pol polyprotein from transposon TNT 1-94, partial [Tanacetum coccineum]
PFSQSSKSSPDARFKPSGDDEKKVTKEPRKEGGDSSKDSESNDQEKEDNVNSTNTINAASTNEVNVVDDDKDVGAEADMNNLDALCLTSNKKNDKEFGRTWKNPKRPMGTKWVFGNKKDERGIVIKNKARLVAQGYIQEEGIDYDEMDVKRAFLYGKFQEEVYATKI